MESSKMANDTRGWIMSVVSGLACVFGASIICVDILIRYLPNQKNFRIQDSNNFLGASLSLSFGVMLFSALYGMLPSSKNYLLKAGFSLSAAAWYLILCFVLGFIGIQVVSRILHRFMPSHVVDCDHSHDDNADDIVSIRPHSRSIHEHSRQHSRVAMLRASESDLQASETSPLLQTENVNGRSKSPIVPLSRETTLRAERPSLSLPTSRRPSQEPDHRRQPMARVKTRVMSFVKDTKANCDEGGPCFGYSDPCGQECFKHLNTTSTLPHRQPAAIRTTTTMGAPFPHRAATFSGVSPVLEESDCKGNGKDDACSSSTYAIHSTRTSRAHSRSRSVTRTLDSADEAPNGNGDYDVHGDNHCHGLGDNHGNDEGGDFDGDDDNDDDLEAQHHHHVPENAFLSIGLQTSIAIALHKLPEGFITYATNHANPSLGFAVFLALFIHNITEGFAMALPLYLALRHRGFAMFWASLLGGISQPLGAGIAALWFHLASCGGGGGDGHGDGHGGGVGRNAPGFAVYGCMFAVTAGIMTSVALQLFVESLSLNHNQNLCIAFAFIGMTILGISSALTA